MSQQIINIGAAPNDGTGDPARNAFSKVNANFTEVYTGVDDVNIRIDDLQYSQIGGLPALGTAATRNVGTDSGNVVEVLAGNKLPALDGSNLTNVSGGGGGGSITIDGVPTSGQVAFWTASNHLEGRVLVSADISDLETATGIPVGGSTGQILAKDSGTDFDTEWINAPISVPTGGTTGQLLAKNSGTDYDIEWIDSPTSLPVGGTVGQVLTKDSSTNGDATWHTLTADVVGPASAIDSAPALYNTTTGKLLKSGTTSQLVPTAGATNGKYLSVAAGIPAWVTLPSPGTGDVVGPVSVTDSRVALFDGTTGKLLKQGVAGQLVPTAGTANGKVLGFAAGIPAWVDVATGGDVTGPASSVNGRAVIFSGTTGKIIAQASAAPVLEGDTRLTDARAIADGDYVDFAVLSGTATIPRTSRTLTKVAGYDSGNLIGSMDLEDTNEVADTLNYNDITNTPSNMTASELATWAGPDIATYISTITYNKVPVRVVDFQASATLSTAYANGQVVGGVTVATGDSILLAGRSTGSQNGVYIVQASGSPVRRTDADTSAELKGAVYLCLEGTSAGLMFRNTNASTITVGSTSITYTEIPGTTTVAEVIAGTDAVKRITPATLAGFIGKGSNVAAAATTTLGNGDYFHITGTTGITAFAFTNDRAGRSATLYFEGAALITNSANLITSSGETFTTTAGDTFLLVSEGSGVFRLFPLKRARSPLILGSVSGNFAIPILSHHSGITVTLTGNSTINSISGLIDGGLMGTIELFVTQGGSGSYTLTDSTGSLTPMGSDAYTLVSTVGATTILLLQGTPGGNFFVMNTGRSY